LRKLSSQAVQKDLRGEAREKSILRPRSGRAPRPSFERFELLEGFALLLSSEVIERNETYDAFSNSLCIRDPVLRMLNQEIESKNGRDLMRGM
jgi:hypothetical protein